MSDDKKTSQAREGLLDAVKGKTKEVVGAVIGNDSLTTEGQLEQAQARERKEANITEAVADANVDETREELANARAETARERAEVEAETAAAKAEIQTQRQDEKRIVEEQGRHEIAAAATTAQVDAQREVREAQARADAEKEAAREDIVEAAAEHETAVKVTGAAKSEADRLRERADNITEQADLP